MKPLIFASVLSLANGFLVPDEQMFGEIVLEQHEKPHSLWDNVPSAKDIRAKLGHGIGRVIEGAAETAEDRFDRLLSWASDEQDYHTGQAYEAALYVSGWLSDTATELFDFSGEKPGRGPHHRRPHRPHDRPDHHKSNQTVYQIISKSKYTTNLAKLINEYDDLVELLNSTATNFTVFAPNDKAFDKIPKNAPKPSKEFLKKLLTYHVATDIYPAGRVIYSDTIPTACKEPALGDYQRLAVRLGLKGLTINFYSRVVASNIFASNGVIHGIDSILLPPPSVNKIISLLPGEFSTLMLAYERTGLGRELAHAEHVGGTVFAPNNIAFQKLGPDANAFLFSEHGLKYLEALLKYHLVANQTLYSDAFHKANTAHQLPDINAENEGVPQKQVHVDLPTLLGDRSLPVDINRVGPLIIMRVNGFSRVVIKNGVAKDCVIHLVSDVLVPPKRAGETEQQMGVEISVDDLKERLAPYVETGATTEGAESVDGFKWEI